MKTTTGADAAMTFFHATKELLIQLAYRWMDEREYEDIADYAIPLKTAAAEAGVKIVKMTKRPFGVKFDCNGDIYHATVNPKKRKIGMTVIRA